MDKKDAKKEALDQALLQIEKQFGKGAIMKMGDRTNEPIDVIPTGCLTLDLALGIGEIGRAHV